MIDMIQVLMAAKDTNKADDAVSGQANATEGHAGNADSRKLAKDWQAGKGNTRDRNFVTPGDLENPETFDEVMKQKQGEKGFTGKY